MFDIEEIIAIELWLIDVSLVEGLLLFGCLVVSCEYHWRVLNYGPKKKTSCIWLEKEGLARDVDQA